LERLFWRQRFSHSLVDVGHIRATTAEGTVLLDISATARRMFK